MEAALLAHQGGADQITVHLREDRRHIQDKDIINIRNKVRLPLHLEMAATDEMLAKALEISPSRVTLVPEKRRELTTEGGLDVANKVKRLKKFVSTLRGEKIAVSIFIDPTQKP
jgi:pyridoxine 5-phosphate synthase